MIHLNHLREDSRASYKAYYFCAHRNHKENTSTIHQIMSILYIVEIIYIISVISWCIFAFCHRDRVMSPKNSKKLNMGFLAISVIMAPFCWILGLVVIIQQKLKAKKRDWPEPVPKKLRKSLKKDTVFYHRHSMSLATYNKLTGKKLTLEQVYGKKYVKSLTEEDIRELDNVGERSSWISRGPYDNMDKRVLRIRDYVRIHSNNSSLHGLYHWDRVYANGQQLLTEQVNSLVLGLFAYLHDACRENDGADLQHGERATILVDQLKDSLLYDVSDSDILLLKEACRLHSVIQETGDPTIDACFDADRLDLGRVGIIPDPTRMATDKGKQMAAEYQYPLF